MELYITRSIFHLARLLCVMPETFGQEVWKVQNKDKPTVGMPVRTKRAAATRTTDGKAV
jgi:hypothetical protein